MTTRDDILRAAGDAINGPRRDPYGSPQESFQRIADLWTAAMSNKADGRYVVEFTAADVALMLALLKIGRLANSRDHFDSWLDLAGYAALGAEVAGATAPVEQPDRYLSGRCEHRDERGRRCILLLPIHPSQKLGEPVGYLAHDGAHVYDRR